MHVLIAGCGWLGSALGQRLLDAGHIVYGLRREPSALPASFTRLAADLSDPASLRAALAPHRDAIDTLVYAAGSNGRDDASYRLAYDDGVARTLDALDGAPLERALFTSSTAVYDAADGDAVDEDTLVTEEGHARHLLAGERRIQEACPRGVAFRLAGLYGPGRTRLVQSVHEGTLGRDGRSARQAGAPGGRDRWTNRIHQRDAAGAIAHLLRLEDPAPVYIGVDEDVAPLSEVAAFLAERLRVDPPALDGPPTGKRCSSARLRASGYRFEVPSYRDGYPAILEEYLATR